MTSPGEPRGGRRGFFGRLFGGLARGVRRLFGGRPEPPPEPIPAPPILPPDRGTFDALFGRFPDWMQPAFRAGILSDLEADYLVDQGIRPFDEWETWTLTHSKDPSDPWLAIVEYTDGTTATIDYGDDWISAFNQGDMADFFDHVEAEYDIEYGH